MLVDRGPYRRASLRKYLSQMNTANPHVVFDDFVAEILEQQGFAWEEEPRSVYEPQQLYAALQRYATDWSHFNKLDRHLEFGFRMAYKIFAKPKGVECLKPFSDEEVIQKALKKDKSSGLPLMTTKAESLTYSLDRESQIRQGIKAPNPCVAYKRTQKGNKTRLVWGYPLEMTIMEARFARPLIDTFKKRATPMAFGMTKTELGAKLACYFEGKPGTTICLDYSKYDTTLSAEMIRRAFVCLATWFSREDQDALGWETLIKYFIHTPIVMPDGHLYTGKNHGVPSGSYFTQMIDSVVNVALCYALKSKFKLTFGPRQLYVLGDDVILQHCGPFSLSEMANYLNRFGLQLHDDEKTVVGSVHFLGAVWNKGKPDAPIEELTKKAVFPENFRVYGDKPCIGAENVLRSYACSYKSAFQLIPTPRRFDMFQLDKPRLFERDTDPRWLSGSDKFFFEEYALVGRKRLCGPTLSLRFLL
jgi:hypothetical protein